MLKTQTSSLQLNI